MKTKKGGEIKVMYTSYAIILKEKDKDLKEYCSKYCQEAKLFKNAVIFRLRQLYFAWIKDYNALSEHEIEVLDEFMTTYDKFLSINKEHMFPTYNQFERMLRNTKNPDFFNGLPMQCNQQIIKESMSDFKSYFNAKKEYQKNTKNTKNKGNSSFTGKPRFPKYAKSSEISFDITNQDAVIYCNEADSLKLLKLPKTKIRLNLGNLDIKDNMKLKEVTIKPFYDTYKICLVFEVTNKLNEDRKVKKLNKKNALGIDLGVDNIITTSNNCGLYPFVIKGNEIKSRNQWYNKLLSKYTSKLRISTNKGTKESKYTSKRIRKLNMYRNNYVNDKYNKIASYIIKYCQSNNIGTIIIGKNDQWKSEIDMQKKDKQNFVYISHSVLVSKIKMMAIKYEINVIEHEESYTSKASFLDNDDIPIYEKGKKDTNTVSYKFSGKRIKRGLYKTKNGILINADVNGASNIIRKALGNNVFDDIQNFDYLVKTVISVRI